MHRRWRVFSLAVILTLAGDQLAKVWARGHLVPGRAVRFLGGFWDWELSFNTGSAFGLFSSASGARIFLSAVGIVACIGIMIWLRRTTDKNAWFAVALGLVFGGALGNVIDRVIYGEVTDFVLWHAGTHRWPAFNVADAALVAGVIILFLDLGRAKKKAA